MTEQQQQAESYEQQLARLQQIVSDLERDDLELNRALALFEEGVARLRTATAALERVEARVRVLSEQDDGELVVGDLDG